MESPRPFDPVSLAPIVWIPAIRNFLATLKGSLEMSVDFVAPLQRENDCYLMDSVVNGPFDTTEKKLINACQLYLGVTLLSDTTNAAGTEIRKEIINGTIPTIDTFKGSIPYQANPNVAAWSWWQKALPLIHWNAHTA